MSADCKASESDYNGQRSGFSSGSAAFAVCQSGVFREGVLPHSGMQLPQADMRSLAGAKRNEAFVFGELLQFGPKARPFR